MKFNKFILGLAVAGAMLAQTASAQVDVFKSTRTLVVQTPVTLATALTTNTSVDLIGYQGIVKLDLMVNTNGASGATGNTPGAGTLTATIYGSTDLTNWAAISYSKAVNTGIIYTNSALGNGANVYFTDTFLLPGTVTMPTASSSGFATPYLASIAMTNQTAISITGSGFTQVGFNATDAPRYLQVVWTGTLDKTTNAVVGALLTGQRAF